LVHLYHYEITCHHFTAVPAADVVREPSPRPAPVTRPGVRARGAARRRSIVDATLTLLGRGGSGAVTHRSVAAEAGVPLAATTYYFRTKDELVLEAFALAMTEDVAALGAAAPLATDDPPTVPHVAAWLAALLVSDPSADRRAQLGLFELELEAARRPELAPLSRAWTEAYVRAVAPALALLGSSAPERDAWIVVTAAEGMNLELLASGERDAEAVLLPAIERLLDALCA
jgi:TetR/AcrR family transcriptional regulator, regulator of biofilm formation and stress response